MRQLKDKLCLKCNTSFSPTGSCQKFCQECRVIVLRESSKTRTREYRRRKGVPVGVGKGGSNQSRHEDSQYKNGIGFFMKIRTEIKANRRYCNRCQRDLSEATRYQWCVHHIDHDRSNNDEGNLELLCKRCHQIEHNCHRAFEGSTTREQSRRDLD